MGSVCSYFFSEMVFPVYSVFLQFSMKQCFIWTGSSLGCLMNTLIRKIIPLKNTALFDLIKLSDRLKSLF